MAVLTHLLASQLNQRCAGILLQRYQALVDTQRLRPDAQQQACVQQLSQLCDQLSAYSLEVEVFQEESLKYLVMFVISRVII
jgi:predicted ATPase